MKRTRFISLRLAVLVSSAAFLTACGEEIIGNPMPDDIDGDGFLQGEDCDDQDPLVYPDAIEQCDDVIDNDCDGAIDHDDVDCSIIANG